MAALVAPVLIVIVVAILMGGSVESWAQRRIRWWPLGVVALAIQLPLYSPPFDEWPVVGLVAPLLGMLTMGLVLVVLLRNAVGPLRAAYMVAALGVGLNLGVMLMNGGEMPRAEELAVLLGDSGIHREVDPLASNTVRMTPDSRLTWFADVIPEPAWVPFANLVSIGDLLLTFGAAWCAFVLTRGEQTPGRIRAKPAET